MLSENPQGAGDGSDFNFNNYGMTKEVISKERPKFLGNRATHTSALFRESSREEHPPPLDFPIGIPREPMFTEENNAIIMTAGIQ